MALFLNKKGAPSISMHPIIPRLLFQIINFCCLLQLNNTIRSSHYRRS